MLLLSVGSSLPSCFVSWKHKGKKQERRQPLPLMFSLRASAEVLAGGPVGDITPDAPPLPKEKEGGGVLTKEVEGEQIPTESEKPNNPHNFEPKWFNRPSWCRYCGGYIWQPLGKQGFLCSNPGNEAFISLWSNF